MSQSREKDESRETGQRRGQGQGARMGQSTGMGQNVKINGDRLWCDLMELGRLGELDNGGVTRLSLTPEDMAARGWLVRRMEEAGLEVRADAYGNVIGIYRGSEPNLPSIMIGSHIDSVIQGGKFDGPLGVLGALEVVRTLSEHGIRLRRSVEVVSFTDEEGARFRSGFVGSKGMSGGADERFLAQADDDGVTIREALTEAGYPVHGLDQAIKKQGDIHAYIEIHIEQGKVLESQGAAVGVVTAIAGPSWLTVTLRGEAGHAGTTPMPMRRDPLPAAAELMLQLERIAAEHGGVGTVGKLQVSPGASNVIPGKVEFTIDLRHTELAQRQSMRQQVEQALRDICARRELLHEVREDMAIPPVACSQAVVEALRQSAADIGLDAPSIISGAGHDAMIMAEITDVGMIFVRSRDGISHNPKEWSSPEDCEAGVDLLLQAVLRLGQ